MQICYLCFIVPIINRNKFKLYISNSLESNNTKCHNKKNNKVIIPKHHISINKPTIDKYYLRI